MSFELRNVSDSEPRLTMLLWGLSGSGKTTLAATAPGKKLWLLFDPDGDVSVKFRTDIVVLDMTTRDRSIVGEFKKPDPFTLKAFITENNIDTVVLDSLTKCSDLALKYVIASLPATYKASEENPTLAGYGGRNLVVVNFMVALLKLTAELNKNMIFISHEGVPEKNTEGQVLSVSMMLGGQLPNTVGKDISEVWHVSDHSGKRRIAIRPEQMRAPMKSRFFDLSSTQTGFVWDYNATKNTGFTIDYWWNKWKQGKYAKLPIPT